MWIKTKLGERKETKEEQWPRWLLGNSVVVGEARECLTRNGYSSGWSGPAMATEQKNKEAGAMVIILKLWPIYRSHFGPVHKLGC